MYNFMDSFLGIPLEAITASGNKPMQWEGVADDVLISISAKISSEKKLHYIVYVDLCGYPEKWWPNHRFKLAEASGDNIYYIEIDIRRQLNRLHIKI